MGLLDDIAAERSTPGYPCGVESVVSRMTDDERADFLTALASGYKGSAIAKALTARGYHISGFTIQRHRRGECRCGK